MLYFAKFLTLTVIFNLYGNMPDVIEINIHTLGILFPLMIYYCFLRYNVAKLIDMTSL